MILPETNFLETDFHFDYVKMLDDYYKIYDSIQKNQIYISSYDGKTYEFNYEDIKKDKTLSEKNCTKINSWFFGSYTEKVYKELNEKFNICRARFMRMDENNRAYSYHSDPTGRLHIPLKTNKDCLFLVEDQVYSMQNLGKLYYLNTTKKHTALNLSWEERIHFVVCLK